MEKSLDFIGFPTYSILSSGHVRDLRTGHLHDGHIQFGYKAINLQNPSGKKSFLVHRLVGLAFLERINGKDEIDHINRDGLDNCLENLRWADDCDQSKNKGDYKNNKLSHKHIHEDMNRFKVQITRNYIKVINRRFDTLEEAIKARDDYLSTN